MTTEPAASQKPATHTIDGLSRLSIVYLRAALNNPAWVSGLDGYSQGMDAIVAIPKHVIPVSLTADTAVLAWADESTVPPFHISDAVRDTCRVALKYAFVNKVLPVNAHAYALITKFSLKS